MCKPHPKPNGSHVYHKGGPCPNPRQVLRGSCLLFEILAFSSVQTFVLSLKCPWEVTALGSLVISLSPGQDPTHQASCGTAMHIPCPVLLSQAHGPGPRGDRHSPPPPVLGLTHRAEGIHQQEYSLWLQCKPQSGAAQRSSRLRGSGLTGLVNAWSLQVKPGLAPPVADAPRELCV